MSEPVSLEIVDGGKEEVCPYVIGITQLIQSLQDMDCSEEVIKHSLAAYAQMHQQLMVGWE